MRAALTAGLLVVTLQMSVPELVELHCLTDRDLQERFDLPASCDPRISAVRSRGTAITVLSACDEELTPTSKGDRPRRGGSPHR